MSIITEIIANFKELLKKNYFPRNKEEDEFLRWLEKNIEYNNGSYNINERIILTEEEQVDSEKGSTDLKNLVKSWARSKKDKQEYWDTLLKEGLSYLNGTFCLDSENTNFVQQTITGECGYEVYYNGKHYYYIDIIVSPGVEGQVLGYIPEYTYYRTHTSETGELYVEITSDSLIEDTVTLYAEPVTVGGVLYGGGRITIEPIN